MLYCLGGEPNPPPARAVITSVSPTCVSPTCISPSSTIASPTRISPTMSYPHTRTIQSYKLSELIEFIETSHPAQYSTTQLRIFHDITEIEHGSKPHLKDVCRTDSNVSSGSNTASAASATTGLRPLGPF